jgi:hypothetical protein
MVIAVVCPVHGAQQSRGFNVSNSTVSLSGNMETCPVPGCGRMTRVMDGTFNFYGSEVQVISAPKWSISALKHVGARLGETVRVLADPNTSDAAAEKAVKAASADVAKVVRGLPDDIGKKVTEALKLSPGESPIGWRKRVGIVMTVLFFLILNYDDVKQNIGSMIEDGNAVANWAAENAQKVPDWFKDVAPWLADDPS